MSDYVFPFDFEDPQMADFLEDTPFWSARFGIMLMKHFPLEHNLNVLDLACGTGYPLFQLAAMLGPSCHLTGLDIWKEALKRAERRRDYFGLDNVSLVHLEGETYPFADNSFDWVVSNLGVNNFDHPQSALVECARVLKAGGRIAITTNLVGHMAEFYTIFRAVLKDHKNQTYIKRLNAQEAHRGTMKSHAQLLTEAGFTIERAVESQFEMRFLDGTALFRMPLIRYGFMAGWVNVIDEKDQSALMKKLEKRLNEHAKSQGGLTLNIPMLYLQARLNP